MQNGSYGPDLYNSSGSAVNRNSDIAGLAIASGACDRYFLGGRRRKGVAVIQTVFNTSRCADCFASAVSACARDDLTNAAIAGLKCGKADHIIPRVIVAVNFI
jgi:hypothetical protein